VLISVVALGVLALLDPLRPVVFVLVLRTNRINATAFLVGWALALSVLFVGVFVVVGGSVSDQATSPRRTWASVVELALGAVLLIVAARRWRRRDGGAAHQVAPAAILRRLDRLDPAKAGLTGALIQPRTLTAAAALVVARERTGPIGLLIGFAVFAIVSTSTLLGIFGYHIWRPQSAELRLADVMSRLESYGPRVFTILCAVAGGYLVVDALLNLLL
jgi:hypothetical protein